jgi:hypothetical protein
MTEVKWLNFAVGWVCRNDGLLKALRDKFVSKFLTYSCHGQWEVGAETQ